MCVFVFLCLVKVMTLHVHKSMAFECVYVCMSVCVSFVLGF